MKGCQKAHVWVAQPPNFRAGAPAPTSVPVLSPSSGYGRAASVAEAAGPFGEHATPER